MTSKLHPYLAIDKPVPPLPIDSGGELCFRIEARWVPYILTLLKTLVHDRTWQSDQTRCVGEAHNLISQFIVQGECESGDLSTENCVAFSPAAPFIEWGPSNPYTQPEYIPPGYIDPPFYIWPDPPPSPLTLGFQTGDVLVGFFGIPILTPVIGVGLARFRVNVVGSGTVELHFVTQLLGSMAFVVPDDDLGRLEQVDLERSVDQLPFETAVEVVIEVSFNTAGAHHIDVTFVPIGEISETPIKYGGGIRSVVLCGFDEMTGLYTIRQKPKDPCILEQTIDGVHWTPIADISLCVKALIQGNTTIINTIQEGSEMGFRIKPDDACIIQRECLPGVWEDWYDPRACLQGQIVTQPPPSPAPDEGDCSTFFLNVLGNFQTLLPTPVTEGYTIKIENASGGWCKGGVDWRCPSGDFYLLGACVGGAPLAGSGFPVEDQPIGRLVVEIDGVFYDAYNTTIVVPPGVGTVAASFQMNDDDLSDNGGSISLKVTVCNAGAVREGLTIPATDGVGASTSFSTDTDKLYKITLSGTCSAAVGAGYVNDAFYYSTDAWATHGRLTVSPDTVCGYNVIEVACDGVPFATPAYDASHEYVVFRQGTGSPFNLVFCDQTTGYPDNSGSLTAVVEV